MKYFPVLLSCLFLNPCSKLIFATANAPVLSYEGKIVENVEYGELSRQALDIYIPTHLSSEAMPVVVFFHGGRWTEGDKNQYKFVGMRLSQLGYVVVLPNTRLYPDVKFPTFVEDAAKALAWVHNNIRQYQGDQHIFVLGHSSGAHVGALLIADTSYLQAHQLDPSFVNGFAGLAGPYDFEPESKALKDIFGPPENFPNMVVSNFINGNEPPMLLIASKDDNTVHIQNLKKLRTSIEEQGGKVDVIIYPRGGHASTVAALSWANTNELPVAQDIHNFFQSTLTSFQ